MTSDDMRYNIVTVLQSKLEALDAYRRYIEDCDKCGDTPARRIFEVIQRDDQRHVDQLWLELSRHLRSKATPNYAQDGSPALDGNPIRDGSPLRDGGP